MLRSGVYQFQFLFSILSPSSISLSQVIIPAPLPSPSSCSISLVSLPAPCPLSQFWYLFPSLAPSSGSCSLSWNPVPCPGPPLLFQFPALGPSSCSCTLSWAPVQFLFPVVSRNARQVMAEYRERQNVQIKKQSVYLKQSQVLGKDYRPQRFTALDTFCLYVQFGQVRDSYRRILIDIRKFKCCSQNVLNTKKLCALNNLIYCAVVSK
jgi:hypothetical protein